MKKLIYIMFIFIGISSVKASSVDKFLGLESDSVFKSSIRGFTPNGVDYTDLAEDLRKRSKYTDSATMFILAFLAGERDAVNYVYDANPKLFSIIYKSLPFGEYGLPDRSILSRRLGNDEVLSNLYQFRNDIERYITPE